MQLNSGKNTQLFVESEIQPKVAAIFHKTLREMHLHNRGKKSILHGIKRKRPSGGGNGEMLMTLTGVLMTILLSMAPISELRGAMVYGMAQGIPMWLLFPMCVLANLAPVPLILLFLRKVLHWMQRTGGFLKKAADWLIARGMKKSDVLRKYETMGLFILVAIPLPGTGAWTGALVAAVLDLRMKYALPAITAGVLAAGVIVMLACLGVAGLANIL